MTSLFIIEWIKIRKRKAFWIAVLMYTGFFSLVYGSMFAKSKGSGININGVKISILAPKWWGFMVGFFGVNVVDMAAMFLPITVILLVASEFSFKTARQNVIDGLRRESFLSAKIVATLYVVLAYFTAFFLLGMYFGYIQADKSQITESIIRFQELQMFGAFLIMMTGYGLMALLFSLLGRSTGTAIGLFFFYSMMIEKILPGILRLNETTKAIGDAFAYFPGRIFVEITRPTRYDNTGVMTMMNQVSRAMNVSIHDTGTFTVLVYALGYIAVLATVSYILFRRTDL